MTITTVSITDGPRCGGAVRRVGLELAARAQEAEQLGTMPADLVDRIRAAGLFRILQPRALGGMECLPPRRSR